MTNDAENQGLGGPPNKFNFYYEKSFGYRSVHSDGFVVSPNAKGAIAITFYSERLAIPKHVEIDFDAEGNGDEANERVIEGKSGIIRHMEFTCFIDPETALDLREWLDRAAKALTHEDDDTLNKDIDK